MFNVSKFVRENIPLCICTLGIAIVGYLGYHTVRWIINKCIKTKKIDQVAQENISNEPSHSPKPLVDRVSSEDNPSPVRLKSVPCILTKQNQEEKHESLNNSIDLMQKSHTEPCDKVKVLQQCTSEQMLLLINTLKTNNPYTELDLSENDIDEDKCLEALCQFIKNDKSLKILKIDNTERLSAAGVKKIIEALANNYSINIFEIKNQKMVSSAEIIQNFKESAALILSVGKHSNFSYHTSQVKIHKKSCKISYCDREGNLFNTLEIIYGG